jgi:hypothetical protein
MMDIRWSSEIGEILFRWSRVKDVETAVLLGGD